MQDFEIPAGDTAKVGLTVEDPEDESIAQALINWRVFRQKYGEPIGDALFSKTTTNNGGITITDATARKFEVALASVDTENLAPGRYYHEAKIRTQSANDFVTAVQGYMDVLGVGFKPSTMS